MDGDSLSTVTASREIASHPLAKASGEAPQDNPCGASAFDGSSRPARAAFYVDGFNLYHAIDGLAQPHLKWLNLWALGERLIPRNQQKLVRVVYCSAKKPGAADKLRRHEEYLTALKWAGVDVLLGHFINDTMDCRGCGRLWDNPKEKESDVNLALAIIDDAYQDVFDHAYMVTADSDQGATARMFNARFPDKALTSVVPPAMEPSKSILAHTSLKAKITEEFLEQFAITLVYIRQP